MMASQDLLCISNIYYCIYTHLLICFFDKKRAVVMKKNFGIQKIIKSVLSRINFNSFL